MPPMVIVFAKAPIPGRVKTRLIPLLGGERAAALHAALVRDQILLLQSLAGTVACELHTDEATDAWTCLGVSQKLQAAGDLGERMLAALETALASGHSPACIVGGDIPALPAEHLLGLLDVPGDVTFGPAEDGGFWGIAVRRVHPAMFRQVPWSAPDTLTRAVGAARRCGLSAGCAASWWDVDTATDVRRLQALAAPPPHLAAWLRDTVR